MRDYTDVIDPNRIFTNDIASMLTHYGVEAARATIIAELNAVFSSHAISVDHRHLNLIADFMTRGGDYKAFSRMGMRDMGSPLAKMSFETTVGFLRDAVLEGGGDDLRSPSARLVVGRLSGVGTGSFDIMLPVGDLGNSV
jgi:DNA-directed RNA polymerase I subunit RPA1